MTTKLFLKNTTNNGIIISGTNTYDMDINAPSSADTAVVNTTASGTEIQFTKTAGGNLIQWVSGRVPAGGFTLTTTDISINALENNMSANIGGRYRVFKITKAGVITELAGGPFDDGVEFGTVVGIMSWVGNVTDTAFAEDDRILLRLYITNIGTMATGFTGTLQFNGASAGTSDCFFDLNENVTFKTQQIRAWVGGAATWDNTVGTKWAGVTGGTGGAAVPTATDDVWIDANSGAGTVTMGTVDHNCHNLDLTGFTGTFTEQANTCIIEGSLTFVSGMTYTANQSYSFRNTTSGDGGTMSVTSAGKTLHSIDANFNNGTATLSLADNLTVDTSVILTQGTLDANGKNVTTPLFSSSNSNTRTLTPGSGLWTINGTGTAWDCSTATGLTVSASSGEIKFTNNSVTDKTFAGGGKTYNNVTNDTNGTGKFIVTGSNTFNVFDMAKTNNSRIVQLTAATTNTFTSFKNSAGTGHTLQSVTAATHTLSQASGTNSVSNVTIDHSIAQGGATWDAFTTNGNVDGGNNTGWLFAVPNPPYQPWQQSLQPILAQ